MELAARCLGLEATVGGVYGHTSGPRFESRAEIRWLKSVGVTAVSQTCGPETVLAGELELPYVLAGFPVNFAAGVAEPESEQELNRLLALSAETLPRLVFQTVQLLQEEDMTSDHGFLYRVEGGVRGTQSRDATDAAIG